LLPEGITIDNACEIVEKFGICRQKKVELDMSLAQNREDAATGATSVESVVDGDREDDSENFSETKKNLAKIDRHGLIAKK
jgi:hypothetical protein